MKAYRYWISALVLGWFILALTVSALGGFGGSRLGIAIAIAATLPLVVFFTWFSLSTRFRQFTESLNPVLLTAAQSFRLVGFTFVLLEAHQLLPAVFALPAGYGDMFIGATATLAAWKLARPGRSRAYIGWQLLGITDLVTAVALGTTAPLLDPHGVSTRLMTVLPLSLVPTFFVPLFLIFHFICIKQARSFASHRAHSDHRLTPAQPAII